MIKMGGQKLFPVGDGAAWCGLLFYVQCSCRNLGAKFGQGPCLLVEDRASLFEHYATVLMEDVDQEDAVSGVCVNIHSGRVSRMEPT